MKLKVLGIKSTIESLEQKIKNNKDNKFLKKIEKLTNDLKEQTPVDTGYAKDHWEFTSNSISNKTKYIEDLNQGSSIQAPSYFIENTLLKDKDVKPNGTIVTISR